VELGKDAMTAVDSWLTSIHSAALCQVYDSIFLDVPMARVRFNVNTEYAYIQNFKILQSEPLPRARGPLLTGHRLVY